MGGKKSKVFLYLCNFIWYGLGHVKRRTNRASWKGIFNLVWNLSYLTASLLCFTNRPDVGISCANVKNNDDGDPIYPNNGFLSIHQSKKRKGEGRKTMKIKIKSMELQIKVGNRIVFRVDLLTLVFLILVVILVISMLTGRFPLW